VSKHPALKFPIDARIDYAMVVASIVIIDGDINAVEIEDLEMLCRQLELPPDATREVLAYAAAPNAGHTADLFHHIIGSELKYALIIDLVVSAIADGRYSDLERKRVRSLAKRLGVSDEQTAAIEQKVLTGAKRRVKKEEISEIAHDPDPLAGSMLGAVVPTFAAIVVPVALVQLASPSLGEGVDGAAAGEATVLATLNAAVAGLTRLGLGAGPVGGVVVAFVLSLAAYLATRFAIARAFPHAR
jgi:uncharacterized tellurite resistance protein B-like protein